jgi:hypothetical protein
VNFKKTGKPTKSISILKELQSRFFSISPLKLVIMADSPIGLREVIPNQTVPEKCKDFTINTGKNGETPFKNCSFFHSFIY